MKTFVTPHGTFCRLMGCAASILISICGVCLPLAALLAKDDAIDRFVTYEPHQLNSGESSMINGTLRYNNGASASDKISSECTIFFLVHPTYSNQPYFGGLFWAASVTNNWTVLGFLSVVSVGSCASNCTFQFGSTKTIDAIAGQHLWNRATNAVYGAHFSAHPPPVVLDGTKFIISVWRGDKFVSCSVGCEVSPANIQFLATMGDWISVSLSNNVKRIIVLFPYEREGVTNTEPCASEVVPGARRVQ